KRALLLNAVNPSIGGVLMRGAKGTAKSTLVRSLSNVLPLRRTVDGCFFSCNLEDEGHFCEECASKREEGVVETTDTPMRVVELPINATEDRVAGSIDIERAIRSGVKAFEPGILAMANQNILYVDEINLLDDHIVDIILDAAAMGVNHIEREGISFRHPARFVLIGTMNPEEGDLRPQLLDRFGLVVDVVSETNPEDRILLMERRIAFEADAEAFYESFRTAEEELTERIAEAKCLLPLVRYERDMLECIVRACIALELEGHRGEITALKVAITIAALAGRDRVNRDDVLEALTYVLPHRMRKLPFDDAALTREQLLQLLEEKRWFHS
ncbi:MAG: AAA family ATPase, partial [Bacillota bacterium]|nr:AAA family ATPase [Bacillota bacterium]